MFRKAQAPSLSDPAFHEGDVSDKPEKVRDPWRAVSHIRDLFRDRIRSLQSVDEAVGRTVAALRRTGELANTLIVFTTDRATFSASTGSRALLMHHLSGFLESAELLRDG